MLGDEIVFPHLYGKLEGRDVESVREVSNISQDATGWAESLEALKSQGWLLD
jgi:uncharacterized protein (DUF952 family)